MWFLVAVSLIGQTWVAGGPYTKRACESAAYKNNTLQPDVWYYCLPNRRQKEH